MEQSYKKGTMTDVISTLKKLVDRQEDDELIQFTSQVLTTLAPNIENSKWTLWNGILWMPKNKGSMFCYFDSTSQQCNKSLKSLRKSGGKANKKQGKRKETPELFVERVQKDEKRTIIDDPNVQP